MPQVVVNVFAATPGKARSEILRKAEDAGYRPKMTDIRVRVGEWIEGFSIWEERASQRRLTE